MKAPKVDQRAIFARKEDYSVKMEDESLGVIVFESDLFVIAFSGKKKKPDFFYQFAKADQKEKYVKQWYDGIVRSAEEKIKRDAEKKRLRDAPIDLKVGDILHSSWGHEQTNNQFFQVVSVVGKKSVVLREIAQDQKETGFMCGQTKPIPGRFVGEPFTKRVVNTDSVRLTSYSWANKIVDMDRSWYWSSYA